MNEQVMLQLPTVEIVEAKENVEIRNSSSNVWSNPSVKIKRYKALGDIPTPRSSTAICQFQQHSILIYGGSNEKDDLNDCYILNLSISTDQLSLLISFSVCQVGLRWEKIKFNSLNTPRVGASAELVFRAKNQSRPLIYIFGGWDGEQYSNEGILLNPLGETAIITSKASDTLSFSNIRRSDTTNKRLSEDDNKSEQLTKMYSKVGWILKTPVEKTAGTEKSRPKTATTYSKGSFDLKPLTTLEENKSPINKPLWRMSVQNDHTRNSFSDSKLESTAENEEKTPFSRRDHSLNYDSITNRIYLFGGWNSFYWTYDETKFMEVWYLDSNWQWHREEVTGEQPVPRRGHTSNIIIDKRIIIIFGGCYGSNSYLNDTIRYDIENKTFEPLRKNEKKYNPTPRAWHSGTLIYEKIYYFGGMKSNTEFTNEVIILDIKTWEWNQSIFHCGQDEIPLARCGHCASVLGTSIIIFGGMTAPKADLTMIDSASQQEKQDSKSFEAKDPSGLGNQASEPKKLSFEDIYVIETDTEVDSFTEAVAKIKSSIPIEEAKDTESMSKSMNIPPALPKYLTNGICLQEEQMNFLEWNPHIFPALANETRMKYLAERMRPFLFSSQSSESIGRESGLASSLIRNSTHLT